MPRRRLIDRGPGDILGGHDGAAFGPVSFQRTDSERRMMLRKFAVLSVALIAVAGLAFAADDESETGKLMEVINKKNTDLRNATRTAANYKKSASTIAKTAGELIEKAKEAKKIKEPAEKAKKPFADYEKLMDEMITKTEDLSKLAEKKGSTQVQAKEAFAALGKTCTACHDVFKKDE
jgi:cytochrome c556